MSHTKDAILITLLILVLSVLYYAYRQSRNSKEHLQRMIKDMDGLQKAELDLKNLQVQIIIT